MDRRPSKKKLSRHLLDMKFMKRTKEKTQIEDEEEIRAHMFESEVTAAMRGGDRFVSEPSFVPVEHLIFGRLAFKGMNAEIESMMAERDQSLADIESRKREKDVTDVEMANSYSGLVATIGNKFATKRNSAGQPSGDRRKALLDMAGQSTNAHTNALLARTDEFLAETRRDGEEMDPERVMMGREETEEEQEERETQEFLAQLRESQECQDEQQMHPEMALMAQKKKDKADWLAYVNDAAEQQDEHPEMAFMSKKKGKKEKGIEKKASDFLSQMRGESEHPSAAKKPKFSKDLEEVIQLNSGGGRGGGREFCRNNVEEQGLKLFVGGVGEETSSATLEAAFGKHGTVTDAYNSGRGFAFITYSTTQEANGAIQAMKGAEIDGKPVRCNLAKPKGAPGEGGGGRPQAPEGCKLFVHGVSEETKNEDLQAVFQKHGTVTDTFNPGRGFAFVTFASPAEANKAVEALNQSDVLGRKVSIKVAKPKEGGGGGTPGGGKGGIKIYVDGGGGANKPKGTPGEGGGGRPQAPEGCKLFVHGVSEETKNEDLQAVFEKHGTVTDTFNPGRGFAFVTFASPAEANKAVEALNQSDVLGRKVSIKVAKPKEGGGVGTPGGGGANKPKGAPGEGGGGRPRPPEGCKLFVHGVSEETKNEDIQAVFEKHGTVTDTFNPGRGFAFVTFASPAEANKAIEALNQSDVLGRKVSIKVAKPKEGGGVGTPGGGGANKPKGAPGEGGGGRPRASEGCKLFVHGVSEETKNEDIQAVFEKHGTVTDTFNPGRGFAFVTFASPAEANKAVEALNQSEVLGRKVSIKVAKPKEGGGGGANKPKFQKPEDD